jgi:hypothetical protein
MAKKSDFEKRRRSSFSNFTFRKFMVKRKREKGTGKIGN